jgi:hypothetical protein
MPTPTVGITRSSPAACTRCAGSSSSPCNCRWVARRYPDIHRTPRRSARRAAPPGPRPSERPSPVKDRGAPGEHQHHDDRSADKACPGCGDTTGVQPTPGISPRVKAWSCTTCRTNWAITVANPQPYFDQLAATVEQLGATRSVLRQVITLADNAATLPDAELRDRLLARLWVCIRPPHPDTADHRALDGSTWRE